MDKRKAAWMKPDIYVRWNEQKHRFKCDSMASILAIGVRLIESTAEKKEANGNS